MQRSLRFLLVEDSDADATVILRLLKKQQVIVDRVADAGQTLAYLGGDPPYAEKIRPDLILLDLGLPGLSGLELLRQIKAEPRWQSMVVIVLTASDDPRDITEAYRSYANSFLVKPFDFGQFQEMLTSLVLYWGRWNLYSP